MGLNLGVQRHNTTTSLSFVEATADGVAAAAAAGAAERRAAAVGEQDGRAVPFLQPGELYTRKIRHTEDPPAFSVGCRNERRHVLFGALYAPALSWNLHKPARGSGCCISLQLGRLAWLANRDTCLGTSRTRAPHAGCLDPIARCLPPHSSGCPCRDYLFSMVLLDHSRLSSRSRWAQHIHRPDSRLAFFNSTCLPTPSPSLLALSLPLFASFCLFHQQHRNQH